MRLLLPLVRLLGRVARMTALLDAHHDRFAAALVNVVRHLTERIEEPIARRDTLHRAPT